MPMPMHVRHLAPFFDMFHQQGCHLTGLELRFFTLCFKTFAKAPFSLFKGRMKKLVGMVTRH
jgi:hypothetical protein